MSEAGKGMTKTIKAMTCERCGARLKYAAHFCHPCCDELFSTSPGPCSCCGAPGAAYIGMDGDPDDPEGWDYLCDRCNDELMDAVWIKDGPLAH